MIRLMDKVGRVEMPVEVLLVNRVAEQYKYFDRWHIDYALVTLASTSFAYSTIPWTGE